MVPTYFCHTSPPKFYWKWYLCHLGTWGDFRDVFGDVKKLEGFLKESVMAEVASKHFPQTGKNRSLRRRFADCGNRLWRKNKVGAESLLKQTPLNELSFVIRLQRELCEANLTLRVPPLPIYNHSGFHHFIVYQM